MRAGGAGDGRAGADGGEEIRGAGAGAAGVTDRWCIAGGGRMTGAGREYDGDGVTLRGTTT